MHTRTLSLYHSIKVTLYLARMSVAWTLVSPLMLRLDNLWGCVVHVTEAVSQYRCVQQPRWRSSQQ